MQTKHFSKIVPDEVLVEFMNDSERAGYEAAKADTFYYTKEHIQWKYLPKHARRRVVKRISQDPKQFGKLMAAVVAFKVWGQT